MLLLREYTHNITRFDYHVVAYPIREALDKKPKYHFIYCTRHSDGIGLMNDFIREEENLLYGEHIEVKSPLFQQLNLADKEIISRRQQLREILQDFLKTNKITTRKQIKHTLVFRHFGYFHNKDYNFVVQDLLNTGTLKEKTGKKRINDNDILEFS